MSDARKKRRFQDDAMGEWEWVYYRDEGQLVRKGEWIATRENGEPHTGGGLVDIYNGERWVPHVGFDPYFGPFVSALTDEEAEKLDPVAFADDEPLPQSTPLEE